MRLVSTVIILFVVIAFCGVACAAEQNFTSSTGKKGVTTSATRAHEPGMKAERGFKNLLFGWTDIPRSIIETTKESKNPFWGLTAGTWKGLGKAFPRTVSGAADIVSFPMGDYNKMPIKPDAIDTKVK